MSQIQKLWCWKSLGAVLLAGAFVAACTAPEPLPTLLPTLPPPQPSPTPWPTPPPSVTPTASPAPAPSMPPTATATTSLPTLTPHPLAAAAGAWVPVPLMAEDLDWAAFAFVARAMNQTERGRHYLALYQQYQGEWMALQQADPVWAQRTHDVFKAWEPVAQVLMYGQGDRARLTPGLIALTQAYLDDLSARASPELAAVIRTERAYIPWGGLSNATVNAAWAVVMQAPPPAPATPPLPPAATPMP